MIIFAAGIHGVGKTYLSKPACERLGIKYVSASQLIREERGQATWNNNKEVSEVEQNQLALIAAMQRVRSAHQDILLDGHFVLRKEPNIYEHLPTFVFEQLKITHVLMFTVPIAVIAQRIIERGDNSWSKDELKAFMHQGVSHGRKVASAMEIPFEISDSPSFASVESRISTCRI
jgi:adenylate kinase